MQKYSFNADLLNTNFVYSIILGLARPSHMAYCVFRREIQALKADFHLLPTSANLGRIMWIMETNIWLLELLLVLNIQIFDIYIWLLVKSKSLFQVTKMISEGRNHVSTATTNLLYFTL